MIADDEKVQTSSLVVHSPLFNTGFLPNLAVPTFQYGHALSRTLFVTQLCSMIGMHIMSSSDACPNFQSASPSSQSLIAAIAHRGLALAATNQFGTRGSRMKISKAISPDRSVSRCPVARMRQAVCATVSPRAGLPMSSMSGIKLEVQDGREPPSSVSGPKIFPFLVHACHFEHTSLRV
jgi:hypothetical protein